MIIVDNDRKKCCLSLSQSVGHHLVTAHQSVCWPCLSSPPPHFGWFELITLPGVASLHIMGQISFWSCIWTHLFVCLFVLVDNTSHWKLSEVDFVLATPNLEVSQLVNGRFFRRQHKYNVFFVVFSDYHSNMRICSEIKKNHCYSHFYNYVENKLALIDKSTGNSWNKF